MRNESIKNNVENKINYKKEGVDAFIDPLNKGITLIALIITIILMLILAGVVLSLTIGENGLIKIALGSGQKMDKEEAREKLEVALEDLRARKYSDETYDENTYIDNYLKNAGMNVNDNIVTVDGIAFEIDRENLSIIGLKQANVIITNEVKEKLGNGIVNILIKIESDTSIESITFPNEDGTTLTLTTDGLTIAKDLKVQVGKEYPITVKTIDGKTTNGTILIPQDPKIKVTSGYPIIKPTEIVLDALIEIDFDENELLENLYSEDNGKTWEIYKKSFTTSSNRVIAKSQHKNINGITIETSATTAISNAVPAVAFDGSEGVYNGLGSDNGTFAYWTGIKRMNIDTDSTPFNIRIVYTRHLYEPLIFTFYNEEKQKISSIDLNVATWKVARQTISIPENSAYVEIKMSHHSQSNKIASNCIYEITPVP